MRSEIYILDEIESNRKLESQLASSQEDALATPPRARLAPDSPPRIIPESDRKGRYGRSECAAANRRVHWKWDAQRDQCDARLASEFGAATHSQTDSETDARKTEDMISSQDGVSPAPREVHV